MSDGEQKPNQFPGRTPRNQLSELPSLKSHPQSEFLIEIITGETSISSAGFPYISDRSFRIFIEKIPHLFDRGQAILSWLRVLEGELVRIRISSQEERESLERATKVLHTVVLTAGVTAPPDLWLLKQVLSTHKRMHTLDWLLSGNALEPEEHARERHLSLKQLKMDLHFLYSRGYLRKGDSNFLVAHDPSIARVLDSIEVIDPKHCINFVPEFTNWFSPTATSRRQEAFLSEWLRIDAVDYPTDSWVANHLQIELGYRLLPLVLGLRAAGLTQSLMEDADLEEHIPAILPEMNSIFEHAGFVKDGKVTELGERVFQRGPGPFGIIGAYHPYLNNLEALLTSSPLGTWVHRGENVAASQDANRKTFEAGNDRLDAFCKKHNFRYLIFIEHAVGRGEATRQRLARSGEDEIRYFGADLEDAAIDQAIEQQRQGFLPRNMQFIGSADIGEPERVIQFLGNLGLANQPAVMMVGNGFHEIRHQTNERMIEVFNAYQEAGFVLIFSEESALRDEALIHTAWNTYHAGFRYVHEISGQGLRPTCESGGASERWSWRKCATLGGYLILDEFCYRSRTVYPHRRPNHKNPSISETYFCVPYKLGDRLDIETD